MQALDINRQLFGPHHPSVATNFNNLGTLKYYQEDFEVAEGYLEEALAIVRPLLGDSHPYTQSTLSSLETVRDRLSIQANEPG